MCLICDRIRQIQEDTNPYFVRELDTGYVVLGDHQSIRGYTLFLCKRHKSELWQLDPEFRARFLAELSLVAQAVSLAFGAEKMNYELLGNGDAHMHWHLFPRRPGDLGDHGVNGNGPVWWLPYDELYDDGTRPGEAELAAMKAALSAQLNQLL